MTRRDVRSKLARMRGDAKPEPEAAARSRKPLPIWMRKRLEARARHAALEELAEPASHATTTEPPRDLVEREGSRGRYFERVAHYDADHAHGAWRLDEVRHARSSDFALLTRDGALADLDLARAVYLDTETTGLSGGAGTYVFQVGLGRFTDDGRFELWQGFMSEPSDEPGLLEETARRIAEASGVVSFFGKSFDRHRLEDKMRLFGITPPFASRPHLDLYHPLWRLYRGAFENGRLRTMESRLCGLERPDDLPGSQAPAAWFDFLAGRPHRLEGVFQHNADDVLSLCVLAAYLGRVTSGSREGGRDLEGDAFSRVQALARASFESRLDEDAVRFCEHALSLAGASEAAAARELELVHARALKRARRPAEALAACQRVLDSEPDRHSVAAAIEAAKLLEHQLKDRARALELCEQGLAWCEAHLFGSEYANATGDLRKRVERLRG